MLTTASFAEVVIATSFIERVLVTISFAEEVATASFIEGVLTAASSTEGIVTTFEDIKAIIIIEQPSTEA